MWIDTHSHILWFTHRVPEIFPRQIPLTMARLPPICFICVRNSTAQNSPASWFKDSASRVTYPGLLHVCCNSRRNSSLACESETIAWHKNRAADLNDVMPSHLNRHLVLPLLWAVLWYNKEFSCPLSEVPGRLSQPWGFPRPIERSLAIKGGAPGLQMVVYGNQVTPDVGTTYQKQQ